MYHPDKPDRPGGEADPARPGDGAGEYDGFSLKSVCWGYRKLFADTIEGLMADGAIGTDRPEVTGAFFDMLKRADQSCFDHVLKEFLASLNPRTRWLLDLPGVFTDVVDLGRQFAEDRLYAGTRYFEIFGRGGFGQTPGQVRALLTHLRALREIDTDLALALLRNYRELAIRLTDDEIRRFREEGARIHRANPATGVSFLAGDLKSSEAFILTLTRECRLEDVTEAMASLLQALTRRKIEVNHLGMLDSDELLERGSMVVCMPEWLYVPARLRHFDRPDLNRAWYMLTAVTAAGMYAADSFPRVHGLAEIDTCEALVGADTASLNAFQIVEIVRSLRYVRRHWPGARRLIALGLGVHGQHVPARGAADRLLLAAAGDTPDDSVGRAARTVRRLADASVNCYDTAERLSGGGLGALLEAEPRLGERILSPLAFAGDFLFPAQISAPPPGDLVADLKSAAQRSQQDDADQSDDEDRPGAAVPGEGETDGEEQGGEGGITAAYLYDEWSHNLNDYLPEHCLLRELPVEEAPRVTVPDDLLTQARQVQRIFERFKPDLARKEKYLADGEMINTDLLMSYLVDRKREPAPRVNFYEKTRINQRDLAATVLLDVSGSTSDELADGQRVLRVIQQAAVIFGQALASLGDRFSVCGFSSNGREHCEFFRFCGFDDTWDTEAMQRVLAARPRNATRIGPALRHAGWLLSGQPNRQKMILLITDGKPMDSGYDPNTRYAQHDVRMACEENERLGIHTFSISTAENTVADMEIMFPRRRFAILPDIRSLPEVLPRLYLKLTI
jgi:hypothetical protein